MIPSLSIKLLRDSSRIEHSDQNNSSTVSVTVGAVFLTEIERLNDRNSENHAYKLLRIFT